MINLLQELPITFVYIITVCTLHGIAISPANGERGNIIIGPKKYDKNRTGKCIQATALQMKVSLISLKIES